MAWTVYPFILYPHHPCTGRLLDHEMIHARQQVCWLWFGFFLPYLLLFPVWFNPFRFRWEYHAYKQGSKLSDEQIKKKLGSKDYGWLSWKANAWVLKIPPRRR